MPSVLLIISSNILLIFSITIGGHEFSPKKTSNIKVEAFAGKHGKILQFNVTLLKDIKKSYEIEVFSVPQKSNEETHCTEISDCLAHVAPNQLSTIIPEKSQYRSEHDNCFFMNDCFYNISVRSFDGAFQDSIIYQTEECIEHICACKHASNLPIPKIKSSMKGADQLNFNWEIDENDLSKIPNDTYLSFLTVDIYELRRCNKSWTVKSAIANFHDRLNDFGNIRLSGDYTKNFRQNLTSECLRIVLNVVDSKNCFGNKTEGMVKIMNREKKISVKKNDDVMTIRFFFITTLCAIAVCFSVAITLYCVLWWNRRKTLNYWRNIYDKNTQQENMSNHKSVMRENPLYTDQGMLEDEDFFEIPPSSIKEIGKEIGKGAFGRVYVGQISDVSGKIPSQTVAIKKLKRYPTSEEFEEFLSEISTMKRVGKHPNIVRLLGSCMFDENLIMVMEYVPCGDLLKYLRAVRDKHQMKLKSQINAQLSIKNSSIDIDSQKTLSTQSIFRPLEKYLELMHAYSTSTTAESLTYAIQPDSKLSNVQFTDENIHKRHNENASLEYTVDHTELHNFAIQISHGMKHLEERQITHRDLAARNILINEQKNLKISDFGLSRQGIYVNTKNKKVPLRWLSIEAMKDNLYSSKSDVWSFAVVLWEIGTLGGFPYPTVQNNELLNYLKEGNRLERPENCSDMLHELMIQCWASDPDDRPCFSDICKILEPNNKNPIYIDFDELSPNYVFPPISEESKKESDTKD